MTKLISILMIVSGIFAFITNVSAQAPQRASLLATIGVRMWKSHEPDADGTVFLFAKEGLIYAFDARKGRLKWQFAGGYGIPIYPVRFGEEEWHPRGELAKSKRALVIINAGNTLYGLYEDTGEEKWRFDAPDILPAAPAIRPYINYRDPLPTLYVGCGNGTLYALDPETGKLRWAYPTGNALNARVSPVLGKTELLDGNNQTSTRHSLYIVCKRDIRALDPRTGDLQLTIETNGLVEVPPLVSRETALPYLIACVNRDLEHSEIRNYRIDTTATRVREPQQTFRLTGEVTVPPLPYGGNVLVVSNQGYLAVFRMSADASQGILPAVGTSERDNPEDRYEKIPSFDGQTYMSFGQDPNTLIVGREVIQPYRLQFHAPPGRRLLNEWSDPPDVHTGPAIDLNGGIIHAPLHRIGDTLYVNTDAGTKRGLYALDTRKGTLYWVIESGIGIPYAPILNEREDQLYVQTSDNSIYSVNLPPATVPEDAAKAVFSGEKIQISNEIVCWKDRLYFGSDDGAMYAVQASNPSIEADEKSAPSVKDDDKILWRETTEGKVIARPSLSDKGVLYFGSAGKDGRIYALSAETGEHAFWRFGTGSQEDFVSPGFSTTPAVTETTVYICGEDGGLYALDKSRDEESDGGTFFLKWVEEIGSRIRSSPVVALDPADGTATIYFGADDGKIYAVRDLGLESKQLWSFDTGAPVRAAPAVIDGLVVIGSDSGKIYGIRDGTAIWTVTTDGKVLATPVIDRASGQIYIGSMDKHLYEIDSTTGVSRKLFSTTGGIAAAVAINAARDKIYVTCTHGNVYEWRLR